MAFIDTIDSLFKIVTPIDPSTLVDKEVTTGAITTTIEHSDLNDNAGISINYNKTNSSINDTKGISITESTYSLFTNKDNLNGLEPDILKIDFQTTGTPYLKFIKDTETLVSTFDPFALTLQEQTYSRSNDTRTLSNTSTKAIVTDNTFSTYLSQPLLNSKASSAEKVTLLSDITENSSHTATLNPSQSTLFKLSTSYDCSISISFSDTTFVDSVNNSYTTGSTFSLFLTVSDENIAVSWPNSIIWQDETAPLLGYKNILTFVTFDGGTTWFGNCFVVSYDFPSA